MSRRFGEPIVVVGYSFRDAPINNAFIDAIKLDPNLRIISMGPHASGHHSDLEETLKSKVIAVNAAFGTDDAIQALIDGVRQAK
jgi:hypothetical protein